MNITSYTKAFKIAAVINGATPCNQLCNYSKLGYLIQDNCYGKTGIYKVIKIFYNCRQILIIAWI